MTNPELAPDMPEELWVLNNETFDKKVEDNLGNHAIKYIRADLAPQAGSVDVEGLKREIRENMGAGYNNHYYMGADIAVDYLVERNLLNPGPQGWRDKAEQRLKDTQTWISENAPYIATDEKHLDENTEARAYWHYGYAIALKDLLNISSPPNKEMIAGAPVGGDEGQYGWQCEKCEIWWASHPNEQVCPKCKGKPTIRAEDDPSWFEFQGFIRQPRPAIPGLQEAQGWQTVENVPRDQDVLVGYLNHAGEVEDVSVAYVSEGEKYHINSIYAEPRGDCRHCGGACKRVYVTHWMPLPAAPRDGRD